MSDFWFRLLIFPGWPLAASAALIGGACWWLRRQENRDAAAFEKHVQARRALERISEGSGR